MSPLAGQRSNAEKAYLHIRRGVCCKPPAKATGFTVGHKKSFEYSIPSPKIETWVGFQLQVCLPKNVYARVQLVKWKPTPLSKDQWNRKKSSTGKPVSESKYFNVDSFHLADTRCTHKRESMDWTHIACLCLGGESFFFHRKSPLLSYNTEGEEWQQENALEGSARCCALPWPGWRRWVVTTHIAGWHKSLGAETPHREIGMRTGLQGTEPGKCIFVSISSLSWFPAKCGRYTCTTGHDPASPQLRQWQMLRREPRWTARTRTL